MPTLDFRNTNALWCSVLAETLVRCGVTQAVCSPGSRSTPLTFAFAAHPQMQAIPILDERSAAFFALGMAKRTQRPVVLVCTSGTAGANYYPAVIEARESGVPLIVITADRPPEMRECASGQTIDQQKLFGSHVRWYHEFAVPEPRIEMLRYLRQTVAHACERAQGGPAAGAVHLNAPFRDPLPPLPEAGVDGLESELGENFFAGLQPAAHVFPKWEVPAAWLQARRGVFVAGPGAVRSAEAFATAVAKLARGLDWPVLADGFSPLRNHQPLPNPHLISGYDAILRDPRAAEQLKPDAIVCLGGWPISKTLRAWAQASGAPVWIVSPTATNLDALHGVTTHLRVSVEDVALPTEFLSLADTGYLVNWLKAELAAQKSLHVALDGESRLFEGKAAYLLPWVLPEGTPLFVANSMPVRDVEYFWPLNDRRHVVFFSRGANGIDGTLSTALGIAQAEERPAVLLTGDLALLHDANGFLMRPKLRGGLTIVLINNRGGGIFEHLPVAQFDPPFEEFFATPQEVDFAKLCAAHGVHHELVRDWDHFEVLAKHLPPAGIRVLELRTDRKRDAAERKRLFAAAAEAAGAVFA
jgi:2-succinyl-5-enolpyruvyl-6-hydroxy-3-cyclohexene-1-carboxylate synthase